METLPKKRKTEVKWTREAVLSLIEVYKSNPCLYNVKSIEYRNRERARDAQEKMVEAIRPLIPDVTTEDCTKKYQSLRSQFRKDNMSYEASKNKSGAGADDIILPKLWCYEELEFLKDHLKQKEGKLTGISGITCSQEVLETIETEDLDDDYEIEYLEKDEEIISELRQRTTSTSSQATSAVSGQTPTTSSTSSRMAKKFFDKSSRGESSSTDISEAFCSYLKTKTSSESSGKENKKDRADIFAAYVAQRLRNIKNTRNVLEAENEINSILSKFELKDLE